MVKKMTKLERAIKQTELEESSELLELVDISEEVVVNEELVVKEVVETMPLVELVAPLVAEELEAEGVVVLLPPNGKLLRSVCIETEL